MTETGEHCKQAMSRGKRSNNSPGWVFIERVERHGMIRGARRYLSVLVAASICLELDLARDEVAEMVWAVEKAATSMAEQERA
jgi:hypothetical protein